jgi:GNAT superfamily N-acetyltransferase
VSRLFEGNETVVSGRICLSPMATDVLDEMSAWLPGALTPEWAFDDLVKALGHATGILISDSESVAIGLAIVRLNAPLASAATVPFLAIEPSRRFRGLGGEAALALDRHIRAHGIDKVFAPVPDGRGLAVYFWLRLGYRPLSAAQAPLPVQGLTSEAVAGIWMLRDHE